MSSGRRRRRDIVEELADAGVNATPDAVEALAAHDDVSAAVGRAAETKTDTPVLTAEEVRSLEVDDGGQYTEGDHPSVDVDAPEEAAAKGSSVDETSSPTVEGAARVDGTRKETDGSLDETDRSRSKASTATSAAATTEASSDQQQADEPGRQSTDRTEEVRRKFGSSTESSPSPRSFDDRPFSVSGDITGESTCTGVLEDFVRYFRDRYQRLEEILKGRVNPRRIGSLQGGRSTSIVGMVKDVRTTRSDNRLVELEDPSGSINVVLSGDEVAVADSLVVDEVVAVEGRVSGDGEVVYVDDLYFPDVPRGREPETADRDVEAVLVSDVHVGSDTFREDLWREFTSWLQSQGDVEYLLVAGDLVEGVGIYPGQEEELDVVDIHRQYEVCADLFRDVPDDVEVVAISGNHDSVRLAEPQPAPMQEFQEPFPSNVSFVGNPSTVTLEGVDVLMYHGVSLNPFAELLPDVEIEQPETAMVHMLRKRHLAPMYGRVRLAPEEQDHLVIDDVPDVLHTGHTHTVGASRYKGVDVVNTGAWQSQTAYQKKMNIQPDVGYAAVLDLSTLDMELKRFDG